MMSSSPELAGLSAERAVQWLYPLITCPACRSDLDVEEVGVEPIRCPACGRTYPWLDHIPVLVEQDTPDPRLLELAEAWNRAAPGWRLNLGKPAKVLAAAELPLLETASGLLLEIGCGDGRLFPAYESRGLRAIGLDFSAVMLQMAVGGGFPLVLADAHRVPLRDACIDTVLVPFATVRYLDYLPFFVEVRRLLRPGGVLGFTAWNAWYNGARAVMGHRTEGWKKGRDVIRLSELLRPLGVAGLELTEISGVFSAPRWSPLRQRWAPRMEGKAAASLARDIVVIARRP